MISTSKELNGRQSLFYKKLIILVKYKLSVFFVRATLVASSFGTLKESETRSFSFGLLDSQTCCMQLSFPLKNVSLVIWKFKNLQKKFTVIKKLSNSWRSHEKTLEKLRLKYFLRREKATASTWARAKTKEIQFWDFVRY